MPVYIDCGCTAGWCGERVVGTTFPRNGRSIFLEEFELQLFPGWHAHIIVPSWVGVDDLIESRTNSCCARTPVAQFCHVTCQIDVLTQCGGRIINDKSYSDLITRKDGKVVIRIAVNAVRSYFTA